MSLNIGELLQTDHGLEVVSDTSRLDVELLLCSVMGCERSYLFTWPDHQLSDREYQQFQGLLERRRKGEPVAYLTGRQGFWTLDLAVNASTLIPRPETELLVETALECLADRADSCRVADLGSGSGAIALAVATERPDWQLEGVDTIPEAVALARHNAERLRIDNVSFNQGSWCDGLGGELFDMIISNPPYIDAEDPHLAQGGVQFEPRSALVAQEEGLADIRVISEQARDWLNSSGFLLFEHGFAQGPAVADLLASLGYSEVRVLQDLAGLDRITLGRWSGY